MRKLLIEICNPKQWKTISTSSLLREGYTVYGANGIIGYYNEYTHEKPTLMITCRGATCGTLNISKPFSYINGNAMALDDLDSNIDIKYLYYYLNNRGLKDTISGSAQPQITRNGLSKVKIEYPSLDIQYKIINLLEKVEDLINKRKAQIEDLDELVKSQFIEMFGDPVSNSKCWETCILQECCVKITDGTHDTPKKLQEGRVLITGKNIRKDKIDLTDIEYVSEEDHEIIYKRCNPEYGDVLYTNIGVNYGTAIFNSLDYEFSMKNVALLKPEKSKINSIYLWHYLNLCRGYILEQNKTGGAQTFMSLATIKKINVVIPPIELQNQFEDFIKRVDKLKFEMEQSLKELEDNFNSLMQRAFKGELFQ